MTKSQRTSKRAGESEALRATADLILGRASAITATPAKDRALQLARIVLREAPAFGGREMRDTEVIRLLKAEQIGLATFKKALSIARKEVVRKPSKSPTKRPTALKDQQSVAEDAVKSELPLPAPRASSIAETLGREDI